MRQTVALIVSILVGMVAVFALKSYMDQQKKQLTTVVDEASIIIAKRRLPKELRASRDDFEVAKFPRAYLNSDMITPDELDLFMGRELGRSIDRGGFLLESDFNTIRSRVSTGIPAGRRLISVAVDMVSGVSNLLKPQSRVDVLWTVPERILWTDAEMKQKMGTEMEEMFTTVRILANVLIYAVDNRTVEIIGHTQERPYTTVTLIVTPAEAVLLTEAANLGKYRLIQRSAEDGTIDKDTLRLDLKDILKTVKDANDLRNMRMSKGQP